MKRTWTPLAITFLALLWAPGAGAQPDPSEDETGTASEERLQPPGPPGDEPEPTSPERRLEHPSGTVIVEEPPPPAGGPPPVVETQPGATASSTSLETDPFIDEEDEEPPEDEGEDRWGQRNFGVSAVALLYTGFGGGFRAGLHRVGLSATGTYTPILVVLGSSLELVSSAQVNVDPYVTFNNIRSRFHAGISPNYKYNSVLGHGGGLSFLGLLNFSKQIALRIQAGVAYFPDGQSGIQQSLSQCNASNTVCTFALDPGLQIGVSIGLVYFPN